MFSPTAYQDPLSYLLTELIVNVLESKISDYRYSASLMGLSHSYLYGPYGIYVSEKKTWMEVSNTLMKDVSFR